MGAGPVPGQMLKVQAARMGHLGGGWVLFVGVWGVCVGCGQQVSCGNIVCQSAPLAAWLVGCLVVHGFRGLQMLSAV